MLSRYRDHILGVRLWRLVRKAARLQRRMNRVTTVIGSSRHASCDSYLCVLKELTDDLKDDKILLYCAEVR